MTTVPYSVVEELKKSGINLRQIKVIMREVGMNQARRMDKLSSGIFNDMDEKKKRFEAKASRQLISAWAARIFLLPLI